MKISIFSVTYSVQIILKEYHSKIFDQYFNTAFEYDEIENKKKLKIEGMDFQEWLHKKYQESLKSGFSKNNEEDIKRNRKL